MGSPDSVHRVPRSGWRPEFGVRSKGETPTPRGRWRMKLIKRLAIAIGSLAALALAGGAHMRL